MGKVMVVDDAAAVLKVMEDILRIAGYEVCCYELLTMVRQFFCAGEELAGMAAVPVWSLEGAMSHAVPSFLAGLRSVGPR